MSILALGLNHKTAPVEIREKVTFGPDIIAGALRSLQENPAVKETVILSTCNRTEVYCILNEEDHEPLADWISRFHGLPSDRVMPYLYSHFGLDAVKHLLRVSCGLDSLVLGEPQILGQVKAAYQTATDTGTTGKLLYKLFQHAFSAAKQIRTDTNIGNSPVSVAFAAVSLAKQIFSDLSEQTALLIGAGETVELAARHLSQNGIGRIIVANRTVERAHQLAAQFEGYAIALTEISNHLAEADIVISSTASPLPVLGKGTVESALKERKHRPIFMVDIAVPRDIEPEVADLSDIYLYTVDDMDEVIQENMRSREEAAEQAEEIIEHYVDDYMGWLRSLDAVELIQDYRGCAEQLRDEVMQKALQQLAKGKSPEEAIRFIAHTLTNKLLHTPSTQMRQAGFNGQIELLEAANTLFQIKKTDNKT
ncbi:MAG: glutamyl-tRNA reductase [Candidatus Thiodiazotropha lotti]|uniref:Glutamyl-tRNA reductase n=1 Tax=Candidatus Thiodiazotropha lotti TaxID=2792787 RepID=A0A9E4N0I4_9GAMM|nr:glutamyl-tRNA reductase [Candidatus Thiodiazotropha endoloripes]MCG7872171.1 glutamyl-tRNA reductase [Candidatus Thiodiazotropha lotti]MCG7898641.1 glutamyl-tRNA reductase [Candidatus Thiodiazotropha weberae]MCG7901975.1 glutamyl-tRNA reductase [Candidatus Thiodiazotropha weberae]MCG7914896.1 glutamyl-tRNA reductase [Candidatus Thiodiazotropha weberae]MCG7922126.1 glutamyl-tRNA reductase [Candidatus Thiodiazotropha lotti]